MPAGCHSLLSLIVPGESQLPAHVRPKSCQALPPTWELDGVPNFWLQPGSPSCWQPWGVCVSSPQKHQDEGVFPDVGRAEQVGHGRAQLFCDILFQRQQLRGESEASAAPQMCRKRPHTSCIGGTPAPTHTSVVQGTPPPPPTHTPSVQGEPTHTPAYRGHPHPLHIHTGLPTPGEAQL